VRRLEDIPNVGPATAGDLRQLGITEPAQLVGADGYELYERLCAVTGHAHDPCCIDVFLAVVDYMAGAPRRPWWHYTPQRKAHLSSRGGAA
jgi:hypothetical protein